MLVYIYIYVCIVLRAFVTGLRAQGFGAFGVQKKC